MQINMLRDAGVGILDSSAWELNIITLDRYVVPSPQSKPRINRCFCGIYRSCLLCRSNIAGHVQAILAPKKEKTSTGWYSSQGSYVVSVSLESSLFPPKGGKIISPTKNNHPQLSSWSNNPTNLNKTTPTKTQPTFWGSCSSLISFI